MAKKRISKTSDTDQVRTAPATDAAGARVLLPTDCRLAAQWAVKDELLASLGAGSVTIDGSQVERADTAALQLLVLFKRELIARGGSLRWHGMSEAFNEAVGLLGLHKTLDLPAAAPA